MVLHLRTVRFLGHAGSDVELGYRSRAEIAADHARDPLLATAAYLVEQGVLTPDEVLDRYEATRAVVMDAAQRSSVSGGSTPRRGGCARSLAPDRRRHASPAGRCTEPPAAG